MNQLLKRKTLIAGLISLMLIGGFALHWAMSSKWLAEQRAEWASNWSAQGEKKGEWMAEQESLAQAIQKAAGDGKCLKSADCRAIGLGNASCKKFLDFFVYSKRTAEEAKLKHLVKKFNRLSQKIQSLSINPDSCFGSESIEVECRSTICQAKK